MKKKLGLVVILLFVGAMIFGITQIASNPEKYGGKPTETLSPEDQKAALLEFDSTTWEHFSSLYHSHNSLINLVSAYSNGEIDSVSFYSKCEEAKDYFSSASTSFEFGKTEYENTYLDAFKTVALEDQMAVQSLMKYIDSLKISDLNAAKKNIETAQTAFETIASNRGTLLVDAGLSDEEIKEKVEADMAALDTEN